MKLPTSVLKPEGSIMAGIATGALVYGIYTVNVGSLAQAHATSPADPNLRAARKKAAIEAVAAVSAISLLVKDVTIFILGGGIVVLLDWHARHAIETHPQTGQLVDTNGYQAAQLAQPASAQGPDVGAGTVQAYG